MTLNCARGGISQQNLNGENCIIYTLLHILIGWSSRGEWDGWTCSTHGRDEKFI